MATQSVMKDRQGPDWPLGAIAVTTPSTPVSIMSLVDSTNVNAPETATSTSSDEYSPLCQQIMFQGFKSNGGTGMVPNTGNVYIMRKGVQGLGNRTDFGAMVEVLLPGQTIWLASSARNRDTFSPYRYYLDADNANDGALVTLLVQ
jgi:hypothetical protein